MCSWVIYRIRRVCWLSTTVQRPIRSTSRRSLGNHSILVKKICTFCHSNRVLYIEWQQGSGQVQLRETEPRIAAECLFAFIFPVSVLPACRRFKISSPLLSIYTKLNRCVAPYVRSKWRKKRRTKKQEKKKLAEERERHAYGYNGSPLSGQIFSTHALFSLVFYFSPRSDESSCRLRLV